MIFEELKINDVILPNRVTAAPMCQYSAVDGCPTDWHYGHLSQLLTSGAGMVMLESTSVSLDGRITSGDLSLSSDNNFKSIQKLFGFSGFRYLTQAEKARHTFPGLSLT